MYQFSGSASIFNGRFWRDIPIRVKASTYPSAMQRAMQIAYKDEQTRAKSRKKRVNVANVVMRLERLGPVESNSTKVSVEKRTNVLTEDQHRSNLTEHHISADGANEKESNKEVQKTNTP